MIVNGQPRLFPFEIVLRSMYYVVENEIIANHSVRNETGRAMEP